MRIQRKDSGRSHWYIDLDAGGERVPGVTTLTDQGMPKPALYNWNAEATANYTLDNWDTLAALPPSERLAKMKKGRWEMTRKAKARGTAVHTIADKYLAGERVPIPDGLEGYVNACIKFIDDFDLRLTYSEVVVYSEANRHCGQLDVLGDIYLPDIPEYEHVPRLGEDEGYARLLGDWKTGASGIFGDVGLQLAPYRFSEFMILPDGTVVPMPQVDLCAGIHLRPDGEYQFVELLCDEDTYRDFLYVKEVARIVDGLRDLVGATIVPESGSKYALVRLDDDEVPDGQLEIPA
jgi:hypothetical protein